MALKDGIEAGGVYASVGLDFEQLDRDLAELDRKLDAKGRSARLDVGANVSGGGGGGGTAQLGALVGIGGAVYGLMRRMTASVATGMGQVAKSVQSAAASLKTVADATRATQKAAHDLYREEARQYHSAQATRLFARTAGGQRDIERGTGFARLPADIRYIAGAGFGSGIRAVRPGATAAPAVPASAASPGTIPFPTTAPGDRYRLGRAGASMPGAIPLTVLKGAYELLRRTETGLAALGHTGVLAFTMVSGAIRGVELRMQRLGAMLAPIGTLIGGTFRLAAAPIRGLFSLLSGGGSGGGGSVLAAPFRAASAAADGLHAAASRTFQVIKLGAIGGALGLLAKGFWDAAKADQTSAGLMGRLAGNVSGGAEAIGSALQPAFQEVMALVIDVTEATKGITPLLASVAGAIGGAIKGVFHFIRQMVANWGAAQEFIKVTFLQFAENASYAVGYIAEVFGRFLDWFGNNWRTIFLDAFTVVTDGIRNMATNIWDFIKAIFEWLKDPVNNSFEFKATPLLDTSKLETDALELPEFKLPNSLAGRLSDLAAQIMATTVTDPKDLALGGKGDDKGRSRVGDLLGARELHEMLQKGAQDKEAAADRKRTAKATEKGARLLEDIAGKLGKGIVGVMGF